MTVRVIDEGVYSEPMHHALDQVLLDRLDRGEIEPTVRFWYRERPAVPLGRFQAHADEVALDYLADNEIDLVRRVTGGGAMYVEPGAVITYSLYLPRSAVSENVEDSYAELDQWTIDALRELGVDASHEPLNDIVHPDGKLGGAAQLRTDDAVVHHTTLSYDLDITEMLRVLRIGEQKLSDKAISSAEKRVAVLQSYTDTSRDAVIERMKDSISDRFDTFVGSLSDDALEAARSLSVDQFGTDEWNRQL